MSFCNNFVAVATCVIVAITAGLGDAGNTCSWETNAGKLDLCGLEGETIACDYYGTGGDQYTLTYTPFIDGVDCMGQPVMTAQTNSYNSNCWNIATYENVAPVNYSVSKSEAWLLSYPTGTGSGSCPFRQSDVKYFCENGSIPYNKAKLRCGEEKACVYEIFIYSEYACTGSVANTCSWESDTGKKLDLCDLEGQEISCEYSNFADYTFYRLTYTPFSNGVYCSGAGNVMASQTNLQNGACGNIASYAGVTPVDFSGAAGEAWLFSYPTGSDSLNCTFGKTTVVKYFCDHATPYDKDKLKCAQQNACLFEILIYSHYACAWSAGDGAGGYMEKGKGKGQMM